jgi:hypothetical protein
MTFFAGLCVGWLIGGSVTLLMLTLLPLLPANQDE